MAAPPPPPAVPPAPLWVQQLRLDVQNDVRNIIRAEVLPDLKRLMNQHRGDGSVVPLEVVPFTNGDNPTQPPNLNGHNLNQYLNGYGVAPPVGANPHATNHLWKETVKSLVGALDG